MPGLHEKLADLQLDQSDHEALSDWLQLCLPSSDGRSFSFKAGPLILQI